MKTKFLVLSVFLTFSFFMHAQLHLDNAGAVGIGTTYPGPYNGGINEKLYLEGNWRFVPQGASVGMNVYTIGSDPAIVPSGTYGWGYLGTSTNPWWYVYTSYLYVDGVQVTSDERRKTNFRDVKNSLDKLKNVQAFKYDLITEDVKTKEGNLMQSKIDKNQRINKNRIGFTAQNLMLEFPELVSMDSITGKYSVDYFGMIPVLSEAIKELDTKTMVVEQKQSIIDSLITIIKSLDKRVKTLEGCVNCKNQKSSESTNFPVEQINSLGQNSPNPFSEQTVISYSVAQDVQKATVYVYDMQGNQKKSYLISTRGKGALTIKGYEFKAGMYMYSLIVDGKEVDTKRMILTE